MIRGIFIHFKCFNFCIVKCLEKLEMFSEYTYLYLQIESKYTAVHLCKYGIINGYTHLLIYTAAAWDAHEFNIRRCPCFDFSQLAN